MVPLTGFFFLVEQAGGLELGCQSHIWGFLFPSRLQLFAPLFHFCPRQLHSSSSRYTCTLRRMHQTGRYRSDHVSSYLSSQSINCWMAAVGGRHRQMPALQRESDDKMSLTPTITISTLYETKIPIHSITSGGPGVAFWTVIMKGYLLRLCCSRAAGGDCSPLLILFFLCLCFPLLLLLLFLLLLFFLLVPILLNISSYVSDTFAKISWIAADSQGDPQLYVAYRNNRKLTF